MSPRVVTTIIPTRNRWRMLRTALWSALGQEDVDVRVVVVDDGSTDETARLLAEVEHEALTVLRRPDPGGVSSARNLGLEQASTEWVAFLDDDDFWAPFHLARLLEAIEQAPERVQLAFSGSVTVTPDRVVMGVREKVAPEDVSTALFSENVLGTPSRVVVRSDAARAAGGFDPDFTVAADWDLWLRILRDGVVAASPANSVAYTMHDNNMHLVTPLLLEELARLEERHGSDRAPGTRSFADGCARWIATCYRSAGDRRRAASWYVRSFRGGGGVSDLGRAAGAVLGERAAALIRRGGGRPAPPDTEPWLEQARRIDQLPAQQVPFGTGA